MNVEKSITDMLLTVSEGKMSEVAQWRSLPLEKFFMHLWAEEDYIKQKAERAKNG
jgi:hypothetical protein